MKRILLVDDDIPMRAALRRILSDAGYTVIEAGNGVEALPHLLVCDLILSDVDMPEMGGIELYHQARAVTLAPVFLLTGGDARQAAAACPLALVLKKPVGMEDLLECILESWGPLARVMLDAPQSPG